MSIGPSTPAARHSASSAGGRPPAGNLLNATVPTFAARLGRARRPRRSTLPTDWGCVPCGGPPRQRRVAIDPPLMTTNIRRSAEPSPPPISPSCSTNVIAASNLLAATLSRQRSSRNKLNRRKQVLPMPCRRAMALKSPSIVTRIASFDCDTAAPGVRRAARPRPDHRSESVLPRRQAGARGRGPRPAGRQPTAGRAVTPAGTLERRADQRAPQGRVQRPPDPRTRP